MISTYVDRILEETLRRKPLKKELMVVLYDLFRIYAPSNGEQDVINYCSDVLLKHGFDLEVDGKNNLIASRGKFGDDYKFVCINAHTDTVQRPVDKNVGSLVVYDWLRDAFHTNGKAVIGGDDKCGIAVALVLAANTGLPMKIILTSGEEVGGIGVNALDVAHLNDVAFTLTVDRKGSGDIIASYCGLICAPDTFVNKFISLSGDIGVVFKETYGTYADTYVLAKTKPAVNLSSGYYNAHGVTEFVLVSELYNVMLAVKNAIEHKSELEVSIAEAPEGWQKDTHGGLGRYGGFGGIYAGGMGSHTGIGSWGEYNDGGWYGNVGVNKVNREFVKSRIRSRGAHYGGTYDYYKKRGGGVQESKKCKLEFGKTIGLDDKEFGKKDLSAQDVIFSNQELMDSYEAGGITDSDWDDYVTDGLITTQEYHEGISRKMAVESSSSDIDAYNKAMESSKDFYNDSEFMRGTEMEIEQELDKLGIKSGYLKGTIEDNMFMEYVSGELPKAELDQYFDTGVITPWLYNLCTDSRKKYMKSISPESSFQPISPVTTSFRTMREMFSKQGFESGYKLDTAEDDVFVDYMSGNLSKFDLMENVRDGVDIEFAHFCIDSKDEYDELFGSGEESMYREETEAEVASNHYKFKKMGFASGYELGSYEDDLFIHYMTSKISKAVLRDAVVNGLTTDLAFAQYCIDSKKRYDKFGGKECAA